MSMGPVAGEWPGASDPLGLRREHWECAVPKTGNSWPAAGVGGDETPGGEVGPFGGGRQQGLLAAVYPAPDSASNEGETYLRNKGYATFIMLWPGRNGPISPLTSITSRA